MNANSGGRPDSEADRGVSVATPPADGEAARTGGHRPTALQAQALSSRGGLALPVSPHLTLARSPLLLLPQRCIHCPQGRPLMDAAPELASEASGDGLISSPALHALC